MNISALYYEHRCIKEIEMPRPQKQRFVNSPPLFSHFKPRGIPWNTDSLLLSLDEYEAIKLADYSGLEHLEASKLMGVSRSTFTRLVEKARKKLALFIIEGKSLTIEGGKVHFRGNRVKCNSCNSVIKIDIDETLSECPSCGSTNLVDLAEGFGHGKCCRRRGNSQ